MLNDTYKQSVQVYYQDNYQRRLVIATNEHLGDDVIELQKDNICIVNTELYLSDKKELVRKIRQLARLGATIEFCSEIQDTDVGEFHNEKLVEVQITFLVKHYQFIVDNILPK